MRSRGDGRRQGAAYLVEDINSIPIVVGSSPAEFVAVGGTTFFAATTELGGRELWKTDGSPGVTELVADIQPGAPSSSPTELTAMGGVLFFSADDGASGGELWRSDGTAAGTVRVKDISPGSSSSGPRELTAVEIGRAHV